MELCLRAAASQEAIYWSSSQLPDTERIAQPSLEANPLGQREQEVISPLK